MPNYRPDWIARSGRLDQAERDFIEEKAGLRWPTMRIARALRRHPSTIHFYLVSHYLKPASGHRIGSYVRRGRQVHGFTEDEDVFLEAACIAGHSLKTLAGIWPKRFGRPRSVNTLSIRLKWLASRDDLDETRAA
jgi:hypothetical protein